MAVTEEQMKNKVKQMSEWKCSYNLFVKPTILVMTANVMCEQDDHKYGCQQFLWLWQDSFQLKT